MGTLPAVTVAVVGAVEEPVMAAAPPEVGVNTYVYDVGVGEVLGEDKVLPIGCNDAVSVVVVAV